MRDRTGGSPHAARNDMQSSSHLTRTTHTRRTATTRSTARTSSTRQTTSVAAASLGQVYRVRLPGGADAAVKVLRPGARPLLRADVANLQRFSKLLADQLPVDYYTVFCELERALYGELDFLQEAQSALKVHASVSHTAGGKPAEPAVAVPLPVPHPPAASRHSCS